MPTVVVSCMTEIYQEDSPPIHRSIKGGQSNFILHFSGTEEECREKLKKMKEMFSESNIQPSST